MSTPQATFPNDQQSKAGHPFWYFAAGFMVLVSLCNNQIVLLALGLIVAGLAGLADYWFHNGHRGLTYAQHLSTPQTFMGDTITLHLRIENQRRLPLPWITVRSDLPAILESAHNQTKFGFRTLLRNELSVGGRQGVERTVSLFCAARGYYELGPITVGVSDPLHWMERTAQVTLPPARLLVLPLVVPLETVRLQAMFPFGELPSKRRLIDDPLRLAGVRDYALGDDPRHIHWKASARTGELMTRVFDPSGQYHFIILLDANAYGGPWRVVDPLLQELSICLAASLASWALDERFAVGLMANTVLPTATVTDDPDPALPTGDLLWLPPTSQPSQRERILEALAYIGPPQGEVLENLVFARRRLFAPGTTVVAITTTAAFSPSLIEALTDLHRRDVAMHAVLSGDRTVLGSRPTNDLPLHFVGGYEVWNELVTDLRRHGHGPASTRRFQLD